jgi:MFS family permease
VVSVSSLTQKLKDRPAFPALVLTAALIATLCFMFKPCWETNDDVAMSMVAHGYGLAAYSSPQLIFSNVLWGYLVRGLPTIDGVLGYSLATMIGLLVMAWAMLYFLLRLGAGYLVGLLGVALLLARPTLFPQFTINAGLLTAAAIIGWLVHARFGDLRSLVTACLLAFFGYLVRSQEFFLVLGVALPFLSWRMLREQRHVQIALLLLGVAIASAAALDHWSYSGSEWQHFWELNAARAPFTDFGVGEHLKQRPEIMAHHGYSQNDVGLIAGWFFVDPQIADPKSLKAMLTELGRLPMQESRVQSGWAAIQTLTAPALLPLLLPAVFLFVMAPRWSAALAWTLCLAALFAMGATGRPGVLRVYVPLVSLLLVAPLVIEGSKEGVHQWMTVLMLLLACIGNASLLIPEAWNSERVVQLVQKDIKDLPAEPIVSWGDAFPFEFSFPVLSTDTNPRDILLYSLGGFTHAPFSLSSAEQRAGRGMIERLRTPEGVPIIASQQSLELLRMYCRERLNAQFRESAMHQAPLVSVQRVWCERDE